MSERNEQDKPHDGFMVDYMVDRIRVDRDVAKWLGLCMQFYRARNGDAATMEEMLADVLMMRLEECYRLFQKQEAQRKDHPPSMN